MLWTRFNQNPNLISLSSKYDRTLKQRATHDDSLHRCRYKFLPGSKGNHIVRSADSVTQVNLVSNQVLIQDAKQYRHLPQVLGGMLRKQIRGCVPFNVWNVLDRHLIVLGRLWVRSGIATKNAEERTQQSTYQYLTFIRVVTLRHQPHLHVLREPYPHPISVLNFSSPPRSDGATKFRPTVRDADVDTSTP